MVLWNAILCDAARGGGDAPASKTSRTTEGEIRGRTVRWEWEGDGGKWVQFFKEHSLAMTDALNKKKNQVSFIIRITTTEARAGTVCYVIV